MCGKAADKEWGSLESIRWLTRLGLSMGHGAFHPGVVLTVIFSVSVSPPKSLGSVWR